MVGLKGIVLPHVIGADVNVQDVYGITALILASRHGHYDLVRMLLKAGEDILGFKTHCNNLAHYGSCLSSLDS